MMGVLLSSQEHERHECSNNDDHASHHLVNTGCAHSQSNEHESRSTDVEACWNGDQQWVHFIVLSTWGLPINASFHSIEEQTEEFSKEHNCALKVRVSELLRNSIFVSSNDYLVLHLHDDGVESSKNQHEPHN